MFGLTLRALLQPVSSGGRVIASATSATVAATVQRAKAALRSPDDRAATVQRAAASRRGPPKGRAARVATPATADCRPRRPARRRSARRCGPVVRPTRASAPWPLQSRLSRVRASRAGGSQRPGAAPRPPRVWALPRRSTSSTAPPAGMAATSISRANIRIIEEKLRSFQIPATVVGVNSGPVVTQYEVKPDARVKLSRIEGLADDLAMALAARSIRIEAPIPGKDVVGIEIPNHAPEAVGFRRLYEDAQMEHATSKLTFALGRDVSGKAYAVDLARMPHLLIAGATGSGKSVCVNALITSLLMRATPEEVQLILVDLKRVELAAYANLPHLKAPVIMEPNQARAALTWAVGQMEDRYKLLAAKGERNLAAYNASVRVEEDERLPYIVLVIDELADLIMREGRKVEDPIVKLAQKARAVGIHLVPGHPAAERQRGHRPHQGQRAQPDRVRDGLQRRQPDGARPARRRRTSSAAATCSTSPPTCPGRSASRACSCPTPRSTRCATSGGRRPRTRYDPEVLAGLPRRTPTVDGEFGWLAKMAEDELTPRAAELVMLTGKASTSMMQTKLKVGFNRASRLMEELERWASWVPRIPATPAPRQVYGPDNWLRSHEAMDDL